MTEIDTSTPHLYKVAVALISSGVCHRSSIMDVDGYGEVEVIKEEQELTLIFNRYNGRRFVKGADGVLVEKISLTTLSPPPDAPTTCEQYLREWVRTFQYPDRDEGTRQVEYGKGDYEKICLLTRTERGVIADFLTENKKFFYDLSFRTVRRYEEPKPKRKKNSSTSTREKKYKSIYGTDAQWVVQKGEDGKDEKLDRRFYTTPIRCVDCDGVRWVKPSDVHQVKRCKPCQKFFKNRR